jgi:hypothetical protein
VFNKRNESVLSHRQARNRCIPVAVPVNWLRRLPHVNAVRPGHLSEYDRARPLVLPVQIWQSGKHRSTYALLDSGAEGLGFIDQNWAEDNEI